MTDGSRGRDGAEVVETLRAFQGESWLMGARGRDGAEVVETLKGIPR